MKHIREIYRNTLQYAGKISNKIHNHINNTNALWNWHNKWKHYESLCIYTGWAKKVNPKCSTHNFIKYWPILKFFHRYNLQKICNAAVNNYSTTPQTRRYTTLWNVCHKTSMFCAMSRIVNDWFIVTCAQCKPFNI